MTSELHVTLTPFTNESRVLKETATLVRGGLADRIDIVALHSPGLEEHATLDAQRRVWRIPLRSRAWPSNLLVQLFKYVEFLVRVAAHARRMRADVVAVHSLALLPLGAVLKLLYGCRLVYDCHELETERFGLTGLRQRLSRLVERLLIGRADLVLVVSAGIRDWYVASYGLSNVALVLNCPPLQKLQRSDRLRAALGVPADRGIVLYQGSVQTGRGIEGLLDAFADLGSEPWDLVVMGYGALVPLVQGYAARYPNIRYQPAAAPDEVLQFTASANVGVSYIDNPSLNDRHCLPNKLFEYVMAGVPALVNDVPDQARFVRTNQVGCVLPALSAQALRDALREVRTWPPKQTADRMAKTAAEHCWERQADVLLDAYRTHVHARRRP